jgi:hypothetical protein
MAGACRYTKEAIGLSFKLLEINPEAYTAWNYRKLAFQHNIKELSDPEAIRSAVDDELRVVSSLIYQHSSVNSNTPLVVFYAIVVSSSRA